MSPLSEEKKVSWVGLFSWLLALLFFFYEFYLRVLPATAAKLIIGDLNLSLEQFAYLGSAYYLTYSFMQVPVGLLLDKFAPRLLITVAAMVCTIGILLFSVAENFYIAFLARLLIGLGSAFGFVSLMVVTIEWFHGKHFASLLGFGQALGAIGPLAAGGPTALLLSASGENWRYIFLMVGIFGVALTVLMGLFLRGKPTPEEKIIFIDTKDPLKKRLKKLFLLPQVWWTLSYAGTVYVSLPLLGAFWGASYLLTRGLDHSTAAFVISMIWVGLAVGSPVVGKVSQMLHRRIPVLIGTALIGIIASVCFLWTKSSHEVYLSFLFFLVGFAGAGQNLAFALMKDNAPQSLQATALGMNNTAIMGFAAVIPPIVTAIIQSVSPLSGPNERAFEIGLTAIPIAFFIALLIALFGIKETYCRAQNRIHTLKI